MLKVEGLYKAYGPQKLFEAVNFTVHSGERIGLVGRNGYGKTTLIRILQRFEIPDEGEIAVSHGYKVGWLDQHWKVSLPTVLAESTPTDIFLEEGDIFPEWKVEKMLLGLGFKLEDLTRNPAEFSGGFQMRMQLCKLLLSEPDLLILDEPTNYLDIVSLRWLERFLRSWRNEMIVVSHDRSFLDAVTTHTMAIHRLALKKMRGNSEKLYSQIQLEEETHEKTRQNLIKKREQNEEFIRNFRSGARSAGLVQSRIKMLEKQKPPKRLKPIPEINFQFKEADFLGNWLIKSENLGFNYDGAEPLFQRLEMEIEMGQKIAIVGPNGRGKSTLLSILAKELNATQGWIKHHKNTLCSYLPQSHQVHFETDRDILKEFQETFPEFTERSLRALCSNLMFSGRMAHKRLSVLSGGEKMRVNMGKLLLTPAHVLLLDEPTNHLDLESCDALGDALKRFSGAVIFVSHNERLLHQVADKLLVFTEKGLKWFPGTYEQFLCSNGWGEELDANIFDKPDKKVILDPKLDRQRQKMIRSLESKIQKREKAITVLEQQLQENKGAIERAYTKGERQRIDILAVECEGLQKDLETAYKALEEVMDEYDQLG